MSEHILAACGEIKEIVVKCQGTPTQKLLAILLAVGVDKTADLAAMTGLSERAIQTAKRNLFRETHCGTQPIAAQPIAETQPIALNQQADKRVSPTPPSENINIITSSLPVAEREPEGWAALKAEFNGSTAAMVADVQRYLTPYGDKQSAVNWLGGTLAAFGRSRTAQAWTIIVAKVAAGEPIRNALPLWAKTAQGLKDDPVAAEAAIHNPFAEQTKGVVRFAKPAPGSELMAGVGRA